MAIKFYLYQKDAQHEIHCNTNSTITEIAGAFDLGTMVIEWNECKYAILPYTPFIIEETELDKTWNFVISQDNVEVVSKNNPIKYLHTLTLSQNIHETNNVPLRNTHFQQPYNRTRLYDKGTLFVGVSHCHATGGIIYTDSVSGIFVNHVFNEKEYIHSNYPLNLADSIIYSGTLKINVLLNTFDTEAPISGGSYAQISGLQRKYRNQYIEDVTISLFEYSNPESKKDITVTLSQYDTEIQLSDEIITWMQGKDIIVRLIGGHISQDLVNVMPTRTETHVTIDWLKEKYVSVLGLVNIELSLSTYKLSLWDILDTLNKQCIKEYNGSHLSNYYLMPQTDSADSVIAEHTQILKNTPAPDIDFTQMDLFEAIAKTLSYIDAFPVLREDGTLDFEYLNNLSDEEIDNIEISDVKTTLSEENYTNKLATYYQNSRLDDPITYPQTNMFKHPNTENYGIVTRDDWYWDVAKPIDSIKKIVVLTQHTSSGIVLPQFWVADVDIESEHNYYLLFLNACLTNYPNSSRIDVNITNAIYRKEVYGYLNAGWGNTYTPNSNNSLYYVKGDNKIYIGMTAEVAKVGNTMYTKDVLQFVIQRSLMFQYGFGFSSNAHLYVKEWLEEAGDVYSKYQTGDKTSIEVNVTYFPILDGKVAQESTENKVEKETIVAQANAINNLNRLGNNLQGLIAKLGNEEKSITLPITNFANKIKLGTHYIDELGNNWMVDRIQTTFTTDEEKVIVNATFTKNYNALAQFTTIDQEKRFYEISDELTMKGYENVNEFIYFTTKALLREELEEIATKIALSNLSLQFIINKTLDLIPDFENFENISVFDNAVVTTENSIETFIIPTVYGCGNQICFEMGFEDSLSAGKRIQYDNNVAFCTSWLYTKDDGITDSFNINAYSREKGFLYYPTLYPQAEDHIYSGFTLFEMYQFKYYKKPNEIFHVNYSLCFLPWWNKIEKTLIGNLKIPKYVCEEIYFGDTFINQNGIMPNNKYENGGKRTLYLYVSNEKYSIIDNKVHGTRFENPIKVVCNTYGESTSSNHDGFKSYGDISVRYNNSEVDVHQYKSWCIADANGNIYIAVNRNENSSNYAELSWFTSRFRKV